ncbi:MAG: hypothetical protein JKY15_02150 [Deltaproteobacteria bacterium]|nr:hypothetical protein [Deltaproteobacteria bacterium]
MKRNYLALSLITLLFSTVSFADHSIEHDRTWSKSHRYAISVDPVSWVGGNFHFALEGSFNDRMSIYLPISFGIEKSIMNNSFFQGGYFNGRVGVKYYITGKSTYQGFYVAPLLGFFIGKLDSAVSSNQDTTGGLNYGFRFGYAWNIWKGFWMDAHVGWEDLVVTFNADQNKHGNGGRSAPNAGRQGNIPEGAGFLASDVLGGATAGMMVGYNW